MADKKESDLDLNQPIPISKGVKGWQQVEIIENNEQQILLNDFAPQHIIVKPQYYLQKIPKAIDRCYCRESVANMLVTASKLLPQGYKFLVWDSWRPVEVQKSLFDNFFHIQKSKFPKLSNAELERLTEKYVSMPSSDASKPSPHLTGGAVDLTIIDAHNNELDMGTTFDHFGRSAKTHYYDEKLRRKAKISARCLKIITNRRLLYNSMTFAGFSNYSEEWWHYDYGNQFWGISTNNIATYGIANIK